MLQSAAAKELPVTYCVWHVAALQNTAHREKHDWEQERQMLRTDLQSARQQVESLRSAQQPAEVSPLCPSAATQLC